MKKKIIAFAGISLFICGLYVNQARGESIQQQYNRAVSISCESAKDLAYNVMIVRQTPVSEDDQIQMVKDVGVSSTAESSAIHIVKKAHEKPVAESKMVESVSIQFSNEIQDKCLKDISGKIL